MTSPRANAPATPEDLRRLREAVDRSAAARADGRHPFAATVVAADGRPLAEAANRSTGPDGDPTQHAELLAVASAARAVGPEGMRGSTLYTSAEPCAMCAGAAYWTGIDRVVYALSESRLLELTGSHPENPTLDLPCREVFARGQREVAVSGPHLEDEAARAHAGFWS
ncbi:nucleoside deaminase [Georgenia sp. Z1491]|uniref:nucleoside deaminase n=1 Tax=Georgenia sp. Z1491 TaxID=3416707 RepID=UPI003CE76CFE